MNREARGEERTPAECGVGCWVRAYVESLNNIRLRTKSSDICAQIPRFLHLRAGAVDSMLDRYESRAISRMEGTDRVAGAGLPVPGRRRAAARRSVQRGRFRDTFWAPRIETNRVATIPHLLRELEKQGSLGGFRILAGDKSEKYHGYMWGDSDVYKTIEGMAAALRLHADPALAQQKEQIVGSIVGAQAPDGYLFPQLQITEPGYRHFADETTRTCESYSIGHLIESAVADYRLTGRTNYLAVARRAAELLRRTHAGGELLRLSGHPEIELALIKLYEVTGEQAWLELAGFAHRERPAKHHGLVAGPSAAGGR